MGRARAWVASLLLAGAVLVPALGGPEHDGFPLSSYPMFARDRGRTSTLPAVVAVDHRGAARRLPPHAVSGSDEVILAAETVLRAVAAGGARTHRLCREIAARLSRDGPSATSVEVVTETYDTVAWFEGDRTPAGRQVHARCEVPRS